MATPAELRAAVEAAVGAVDFEPPVTVAFATRVRDELRRLVPLPTRLDVYHDHRDLIIGVEREPNTWVYSRFPLGT